VTGSEVLNSIGESNRFILGGSADLAASTKQIISNSIYSHENRSGQSIEFGIREHAMAAVVNGITLHSNLIGYGSTFLVFSDYMRPSIRLASLMNLNSVYIFTHDSIYLGEDGPTHQPIEHLMSLRLIPGLDVIRPANSIEAEYAYQYIFTKGNNPKSLVLTRQSLDYIETNLSYKNFQDGAYELIKGDDLTIFASGSEVNLAIEVSKKLKNKSVQIISTPILNQINTNTLENLKINEFVFTLELGRSIGWQDYIGKVTESFSIETFGESAPLEDLTEYFEFSSEKIAQKILQYIS
jgi:transketolase